MLRKLTLAALVVLALPWTAQAGVRVSVGVGVPVYRPYRPYYYGPYYRPAYVGVYVGPPPVYVAPAPVYVQPAPTAVYVQPAPTAVYTQPAPAQPPALLPAPTPVK